MMLSAEDISNDFSYSKYSRLLVNALLLTSNNIKWFYFLSMHSFITVYLTMFSVNYLTIFSKTVVDVLLVYKIL